MEIIKNRYNSEELKEFEILLIQKKELAKKEYHGYVDQISGKTSGNVNIASSHSSMETGAESEEKETLNRLAARQAKYIKNLENALIRIKNGTYGVCSETGNLIAKARLLAVPHTTQSIAAKLKQNS